MDGSVEQELMDVLFFIHWFFPSLVHSLRDPKSRPEQSRKRVSHQKRNRHKSSFRDLFSFSTLTPTRKIGWVSLLPPQSDAQRQKLVRVHWLSRGETNVSLLVFRIVGVFFSSRNEQRTRSRSSGVATRSQASPTMDGKIPGVQPHRCQAVFMPHLS